MGRSTFFRYAGWGSGGRLNNNACSYQKEETMKSKLVALCALIVLIYTAIGYAGAEEAKAAQQVMPFYSDWTFWQWFVSLSALVISLAPYVVRFIKGPRISLDVMSKISIHHTLGNPNITLFLNIQNNGGLPVRIRSITLELRKGEKVSTIPAKSYYPDASESKMAILAPFRLLPDHDWSHGVYFYPDFSRDEDIEFRNLIGKLKANIQAKIPPVPPVLPPNTAAPLYEADTQFLQSALQFFNTHFMWNTGEYVGTVTIHTEPSKAKINAKFRFTLYETESTELRNYSSDYKYGLGVYYYNLEKHPGLAVTTSEI